MAIVGTVYAGKKGVEEVTKADVEAYIQSVSKDELNVAEITFQKQLTTILLPSYIENIGMSRKLE